MGAALSGYGLDSRSFGKFLTSFMTTGSLSLPCVHLSGQQRADLISQLAQQARPQSVCLWDTKGIEDSGCVAIIKSIKWDAYPRVVLEGCNAGKETVSAVAHALRNDWNNLQSVNISLQRNKITDATDIAAALQVCKAEHMTIELDNNDLGQSSWEDLATAVAIRERANRKTTLFRAETDRYRDILEQTTLDESEVDEKQVVMVVGPDGAGKQSVVSQLTNNRTPECRIPHVLDVTTVPVPSEGCKEICYVTIHGRTQLDNLKFRSLKYLLVLNLAEYPCKQALRHMLDGFLVRICRLHGDCCRDSHTKPTVLVIGTHLDILIQRQEQQSKDADIVADKAENDITVREYTEDGHTYYSCNALIDLVSQAQSNQEYCNVTIERIPNSEHVYDMEGSPDQLTTGNHCVKTILVEKNTYLRRISRVALASMLDLHNGPQRSILLNETDYASVRRELQHTGRMVFGSARNCGALDDIASCLQILKEKFIRPGDPLECHLKAKNNGFALLRDVGLIVEFPRHGMLLPSLLQKADIRSDLEKNICVGRIIAARPNKQVPTDLFAKVREYVTEISKTDELMKFSLRTISLVRDGATLLFRDGDDGIEVFAMSERGAREASKNVAKMINWAANAVWTTLAKIIQSESATTRRLSEEDPICRTFQRPADHPYVEEVLGGIHYSDGCWQWSTRVSYETMNQIKTDTMMKRVVGDHKAIISEQWRLQQEKYCQDDVFLKQMCLTRSLCELPKLKELKEYTPSDPVTGEIAVEPEIFREIRNDFEGASRSSQAPEFDIEGLTKAPATNKETTFGLFEKKCIDMNFNGKECEMLQPKRTPWQMEQLNSIYVNRTEGMTALHLIRVYHGCLKSRAEEVCEIGFNDAPRSGSLIPFFGDGYYFTPQIEYALEYAMYKEKQIDPGVTINDMAVIVCLVAVRHTHVLARENPEDFAQPIIPHMYEPKLCHFYGAKSLKRGYDSHLATVRQTGTDTQCIYEQVPVDGQGVVPEEIYHELVIKDKSQILPIAIVHLKRRPEEALPAYEATQ